MKILKQGLIVICLLIAVIRAKASECNVFQQSTGYYLKNHVVHTSSVPGLAHCSNACLLNKFPCKSTNYNFKNKTCELNNADKFEFPSDLVENEEFSYNGWKIKETLKSSCAEIKQSNPSVKVSGYYRVILSGQMRLVYCDMETYGGGWSLVASISKKSNDHIQDSEKCDNKWQCVKYTKNAIQAQKLSDADISVLAQKEGTFRIDIGNGKCFFQIPSGADKFSSICHGSACARIIISYEYPYNWQSNTCNSTTVGYHIPTHHIAFDGADDSECGFWRAEGFAQSGPGRFLYGYKQGDNTGFYHKQEGLMFVR